MGYAHVKDKCRCRDKRSPCCERIHRLRQQEGFPIIVTPVGRVVQGKCSAAVLDERRQPPCN
jgi:pyruvate/oxaloacetate carboxyltransferase